MSQALSRVRSSRSLRRGTALAAVLVAQAILAGGASAAGPQITSIVPSSGSVLGGQRVIIDGSGFVGSGGACASGYDIWFGTDVQHGYAISPASYRVLSDSQISVVTPANVGGTVDVRVYNSCGATPLAPADRYTYTYPATQCLAGTCSMSIGSPQVGQLTHNALGVLDGFNTDAGVRISFPEGNLVKALRLRQWRLGQSGLGEPWGGEFALAQNFGSMVSLDLTTDWNNWANIHDPAYAWKPYGDLSTYYNYIYSDVKARIAAGQVPSYFDVWNEPANSGTVNEWLSVYGTAYRAIKAADPSAQVVGPSLAQPLFKSAGQGDSPGYDLSLADFLNYEMSTGVRFAAVTYHEDGTTVDAAPNSSPGPWLPTEPDPGGYRDYWSPAAIGDHVLAAKALIASYPALSGTQVFVNEYGPVYANNEPGWMVGDFASLESAGVDQAMLTCPTEAGCNSLLDGLIGTAGSPQMPYWVMMDYSQESGARLQTSASGSNWYTLATEVAGANTIEALIGRADDCFGGVQCPQTQPSTHSAASASLAVAVPWSASDVHVNVQRLSNTASNPIGSNDVATAPASTTATVPVTGGVAHVVVPNVADGDALYVTVTPGSAQVTGAQVTGAQVTGAQVTALSSAKRHSRRGNLPAIPRRRLGCLRRSRRRAQWQGRRARSCNRRHVA
jgi:IPT/TIG domain